MSQGNPNSNNSSRLSEDSQDVPFTQSPLDILRRRGFNTDSFRLADVSEYVDPDGQRYRIERVGPSVAREPPEQKITREPANRRDQPTETSRITDRSRYTTLSDPFPALGGSSDKHIQHPISTAYSRDLIHSGEDGIDSSIRPRIMSDSNLHGVRATTTWADPQELYRHLDSREVAGHTGQEMWRNFNAQPLRLDLSPTSPYSLPPAPIAPTRQPPAARESNGQPNPYTASMVVVSQSTINIPQVVSHGIDLRTPMVMGISETSTVSGDSLILETEIPGETLILDTELAVSFSPRSDFVRSTMRVFSNSETEDLRFYIFSEHQGNRSAQTFRVNWSNAEFVLVYGYSPTRLRIICIREILRPRKKLVKNPDDSRRDEDSGMTLYCDFPTMEVNLSTLRVPEKCAGRRLLDEDMFLDIERVRYMTIAQSGLKTRQIDAPWLQIWRQRRSGTAVIEDNMSHYTAGTTLSGPMKDRVAPSASRVFVYLGRSEEYISMFVTDDVTIDEKSKTRLSFSASKFGWLKSRSGIKCFHATRKQVAAGVRLDMSGLRYEEQESFDSFKSFELEFENAANCLAFVETWNRLLQVRRKERAKLRSIQEEVSNDVFTGNMARKVFM